MQFPDPISAEELAYLACQPGIDCRLVLGNNDWQLRNGPFQESDFTELPTENWTLLVQAIDLLVNEFKHLRDLFNFLPNWRFDDVMASYAAPGGGVGPHFDFYDVFLVQGSGQRRWKLGEKQSASATISTESGLQLLGDFQASNEYLVSAGDVLYIPPQYAHWGEALSASFCYSVGFRAPSAADMLEGFSDALIDRADPALRFMDTAFSVPSDRNEISPSDLKLAHKLLLDQFKNSESFYKWFGAHMTQPKYPDLFAVLDTTPEISALRNQIETGKQEYRLNSISRVAYFPLESQQSCVICIDGRVYSLPYSHYETVLEICTPSYSFNEIICSNTWDERIVNLVLDLIAEGSVVPGESD